MIRTKNSGRIKYLTRAGIIAAIYVALTGVSAILGMSSGVIQMRLSEALCVLPVFTAAAVPGVTIGCLISNIIFGGTAYDIVFGTLATLIGALLALLFKKIPYFSSVPTIVSNTLIIPLMFIVSGVGLWDTYPLYALFVFIGEFISCGLLGGLVVLLVRRHPKLMK